MHHPFPRKALYVYAYINTEIHSTLYYNTLNLKTPNPKKRITNIGYSPRATG